MPLAIEFDKVSTIGLEKSPVSERLAGLRANEARYFKNKYDHVFSVEKAEASKKNLEYVNRILREERNIEIAAKPLETTSFQVANVKFTYVFYDSGLVVNVMYTVDDPKKRAVGFKLSEGMDVPKELEYEIQIRQAEIKIGGNH